jgi:hypothetical protein
MNYTSKLWDTYEKYPRFFMAMFQASSSTDEDLSFFLENNLNPDNLDTTNTLLLVVSDEGRRLESSRTTLQSRQEENTPVLYIR